MKRIKLIPGHYYIKLKKATNPVLAFYSGKSIAPWSTTQKSYLTWNELDRVIN